MENMDVIWQIIAGVAIFFGGLVFGNGYDKKPRMAGHSNVYRRRMKRTMATGIAIATCGVAYFIIF
jgi:hypothetical protein